MGLITKGVFTVLNSAVITPLQLVSVTNKRICMY